MNNNDYLYADPLHEKLFDLPDHSMYEIMERAAILEYEAGMDRTLAEIQALVL